MSDKKIKQPEKFTWSDGDLTWDEQPGQSIDINAEDTK